MRDPTEIKIDRRDLILQETKGLVLRLKDFLFSRTEEPEREEREKDRRDEDKEFRKRFVHFVE